MHTLLRYNPTDNLPLNCWGNFHLASMVDFFKPGMTASLLERIFVMSQFISSVLYIGLDAGSESLATFPSEYQ